MKIVVLAGGISTERDVSLVSGMGIYKALKSKGHQVMLLDVFLGYANEDWKNVFEKDVDWTASVGAIKDQNPDVVFMALHGENGENGKIQACFDLNGIRYTGTDYVSSAICMNKAISKDLFAAGGVPTPVGIRLKKGETPDVKVPYPCVVKACCGGSSVGVVMANNDEEYAAALEEAFKYDDEVVIEQYIKGREFSVGVVDGKAYPIIEIAPIHGFYDYKNKYQAGSTIETCPAELSEEKTLAMQAAAEQAFKVLRLKNYARMDFMMDEKGDFYCLEANTLPGMTPTSLLPQEAKVLGTEYADLCQLLIDISMRDE